MASEAPRRGGVAEVAATFLVLGCTSFGGPIAHLGYVRAEVVDRRRWLDDAHYADLVALAQFLPGPASSQVVFAVGRHRAGLAGAIAASVCFLLPSALLMIAAAYGLAALDVRRAGWLHGLTLAAAAVIAQAVWSMGKKLCPDRARITIAFAAAAAVIAIDGGLVQLGAIATGAALGWWLYRREPIEPVDDAGPEPGRRSLGAVALVVAIALLAVLPAIAALARHQLVDELDAFYRAGALVFGGGHVVLPLLRSELLPRGWLSEDAFLSGYGAAQALPGPLFSFAAYLGASIPAGIPAWLNGLWCLFAIFLPGWLLVGGALPFWHDLRRRGWARAALAGANAAVVGVLLAALHATLGDTVRTNHDVVAALAAFAALEHGKLPAWVVVLAMAGAGQWLL
ncbi:MAG: chromate efflux transporter [Deltaproteobacteria bacterium]|nr:chromate efflux transporter [Deltaproteobacteria bacterium]